MPYIVIRKSMSHTSILIPITDEGTLYPRYLMKRLKDAELERLYITNK